MPVLSRLSPLALAGLTFLLPIATILGAYAFQAAGYAPCDLCLKERMPYYVGIVAALVTLLIALRGEGLLLKLAFGALTLIFLFSAGFGAFHAGVEWGFWPGPSDCTGALEKAPSVADFMKQLQTVKVVRCDAVAIRILGLSLAGWNAIVSLIIAMVAFTGLRRTA